MIDYVIKPLYIILIFTGKIQVNEYSLIIIHNFGNILKNKNKYLKII